MCVYYHFSIKQWCIWTSEYAEWILIQSLVIIGICQLANCSNDTAPCDWLLTSVITHQSKRQCLFNNKLNWVHLSYISLRYWVTGLCSSYLRICTPWNRLSRINIKIRENITIISSLPDKNIYFSCFIRQKIVQYQRSSNRHKEFNDEHGAYYQQ